MPPGHAVVTCLACRLSKVKCERQPDAVACTRCTRLGLVCASSGVKKRGAQNVKRDVARLGPAVRSLLANGAAAEASTPASALTCASYRFDVAPVAWCGPRCPALLMSQIESPVGRLALLQHWICIALRSGSCAMLGNVLLLAHLGGLTLAKVQALACDPSVVAPTEAISMPLFISEWQSLPSPVFTRTQVNGKIEFLPNQGFDQAFGNLTEMTARLGPATAICTNAVITELKPQVLTSSPRTKPATALPTLRPLARTCARPSPFRTDLLSLCPPSPTLSPMLTPQHSLLIPAHRRAPSMLSP
jgi:hypothetical protein